MSSIQLRLARSLIRSTPTICLRSFSFTPRRLESTKTKPELLPDERLQQLVAELERPLNLKSISIDDTRDNLLTSIEAYRPGETVLSNIEIEKLISSLSRSFTVRQLTVYVQAHSIPGKGVKKQQLMERIINQHWGIQSLEKVRQEQLEKRKDRVTESLPASIQELFFVIGENGETMRHIEEQYDVGITVDVENSAYVIEGGSQSVSKAKKAVQSRLSIIKEDSLELPEKVKESPRLQSEIDDTLAHISKVAGSFITLKDNKIYIASITDEKMIDAKRLSRLLLTELDVTDKRPLDKADQTYVQQFPQYTVVPLHDSKAMSLHNQELSWDRLKRDSKEEGNYRLLNGQEDITFNELGQDLFKPFEDASSNNISLEAKFGYLLFQSDIEKEENYYRVESADLTKLLAKNRTAFFPVNPPYQITAPFTPLTLEDGFHERSIKLEYVNKSLLYDYDNDESNKNLERLHVEFNIDKRGDIELKNIIGEKARRTMDVLGVHGQIDIRLIAKNYVDYNNKLGDLIEKCKLISLNDLEAPKSHDNLILSDIKFMNKKKYLFDNNLITLQHIEQQYKKSKRTELIINSVNPETLNQTHNWPSFSSLLTKVASQWNYVFN